MHTHPQEQEHVLHAHTESYAGIMITVIIRNQAKNPSSIKLSVRHLPQQQLVTRTHGQQKFELPTLSSS